MPDAAKSHLKIRKTMLEDWMTEPGVRLEAIEGELAAHNDPGGQELAIEREGDEVLEATGTAGLSEIARIRFARIRFALSRIADGSYGQWVCCGEDTLEARLVAVTWTPFCRKCAP